MAKNKHWITPGQACEILGINPKALSGIVQNYEIERFKNQNGRGYLYRRVDVIAVAKARDINGIVKATVDKVKKNAATMKKILAKMSPVKLTLSGTRGEIRAIAKLLEFDKRFSGVEPAFSDNEDMTYWLNLRS